ncbi:alpha/beta hydrolase [Lentilactobacillus kisonensis]|nr:alpha/beta hydrolase [Lentilactobacillus kisonensis]
MSFMARRLTKQFKTQNYKQTVAHSFLHPNQKVNIFKNNPDIGLIHHLNSGQLVTIDTSTAPKSQILYFHGGAFRVPMNDDQLQMIRSIATQTESRLQIADFPLLPTYSSADMLNFATSALQAVVANGLPTFLVADSAGAALAVQLLFRYPDKIAGTSLISPWLDFELTDAQVVSRATNDVMLDIDVLRQIAAEFTDGLSNGQWLDVFSPSDSLTGSLQLFYGENELLAPNDKKFATTLTATTNMTIDVISFRDAFHDYILWDKLPETKKTKKQIVTFTRDQRGA